MSIIAKSAACEIGFSWSMVSDHLQRAATFNEDTAIMFATTVIVSGRAM